MFIYPFFCVSEVGGTYKLQGAVVDKEVLNFNTPVWPEFEVSAALWRAAHVAAPRIDVFQFVKGPRTNQDFQAVFAETSGDKTNVHVNVDNVDNGELLVSLTIHCLL